MKLVCCCNDFHAFVMLSVCDTGFIRERVFEWKASKGGVSPCWCPGTMTAWTSFGYFETFATLALHIGRLEQKGVVHKGSGRLR